MPRRTYNKKAGRRLTPPSPDALRPLIAELQYQARWRHQTTPERRAA